MSDETHDPLNLSPHLIVHPDGKARCPWPGTDPLYVHYHDTDWGVPEYDDRALFEKLILDGFQAGLSWITILRKRENFRSAFDGFEPAVIAEYGPEKLAALMADPGIVRNKSKIESSVRSARAYLEINARTGFSNWMWDFVDGKPVQHDFNSMKQIPAEDEISRRMSKELRKAGFNFVGPTIVYAFMQAVGMVNDHLVGCFRQEEVKTLARGRREGDLA
jgi:DNA-3-methyladenine glycosylase I